MRTQQEFHSSAVASFEDEAAEAQEEPRDGARRFLPGFDWRATGGRLALLVGSVLCMFLMLGLAHGGPAEKAEELARRFTPDECLLERWEDADTAIVQCGFASSETVRLLDVDAAESGFDTNSKQRAREQADGWRLWVSEVIACGRAASDWVKTRCAEGSTVQVIGDERDIYGRRLGYIICNGENINQVLLDEGWAGAYHFPSPPKQPKNCPLPTAVDAPTEVKP
ncbi:MAG: thermonuclease family protein [Myxococcota bacterium]|jgi:endonuclease YncB( thermonuclease family)|nr:thermonuclease family protein [Myxococcota bacterium]